MDEPGISTVDGVLITKGALTRRCVPNGPSKLARPRVVVLHPFVGDSGERGGPSKGGEDHDAKHEQHRRNTHPAVYAVERLGRSRGARASSAAMITSCRRSHLSGERPCTLMLSTHTEQTGSATVMRGATHFSRAKSRPGASDTHHVLQRIRASVKSPRPHHGPI